MRGHRTGTRRVKPMTVPFGSVCPVVVCLYAGLIGTHVAPSLLSHAMPRLLFKAVARSLLNLILRGAHVRASRSVTTSPQRGKLALAYAVYP